MEQDQREDQSFKSLMDPRGPPQGQNPFFTAVPTFQFELYPTECWPQPQDKFLAQKMARRFVSMLSKIKKLMLEQTARENNGDAQYVEGVMTDAAGSCPDFQRYFSSTFQRRNNVYLPQQIISSQIPESGTGSVSYKIPTTSGSGLFAVLVQPMGRRGRDDEKPIEPIKVIFSLSNLYSVGFVYKEVFYHYENADVSCITVTEATKRFIVKMSMDGGYMGNDLCDVRVGILGLRQTHDTLSNAEHRTRKEVRRALMTIFVPISEGLRFPAWLRRLYEIYSNNLDVTTDDPEDNPEKKYSGNFNNWDTISHVVARGQVNFSGPIARYSRFEVLLIQSSMLLLSAVKRAYEKNEEEKQKVLRREKEERKLKGKKKAVLRCKACLWKDVKILIQHVVNMLQNWRLLCPKEILVEFNQKLGKLRNIATRPHLLPGCPR